MSKSGSKKKVLVGARMHPHALALLQSHDHFEVTTRWDGHFSDLNLADFEGLLIRSNTTVDARFLDLMPNLKIVVTCTSGFNHIDLAETSKRSIYVYHTAQANAASAAEMTWALVLACARQVTKAHAMVLKGDWKRDHFSGVELSGKSYGVVGFGRVGRRVAKIAAAFNMKVFVYDPYVDTEDIESQGYECLGLVELLCSTDVISFHVPLTSETRRMLNSTSLDSFNDGAIVVNTSRGEIFVEQHVQAALKNEKIAALGLDVFEHEPLDPSSPFCRHPNVVLSPHIGATTAEAIERASVDGAHKIIRFFEGVDPQTLEDKLPPQAAWYTHPRGFN